MRRRFRQHVFLLLTLLCSLALAGCYTMLRHPDVTDEYAVEEIDEDVVIIDRCGACHAVAYPPRWIPPHRRRGDGGPVPAPERRGIAGDKTPVRGGSTGPGIDALPIPGGGAGGTGDTKTRETPAETPKETKEIIKKEQPDTGKTPVRRENDTKKADDDKTKSNDKKKE